MFDYLADRRPFLRASCLFLSPCILPMVPFYLSYLGGIL